MTLKKSKGQTLIEYTVLITIVLGVFVAVGTYVKRGIQGRWKAAVDDLGDQYDPRYAVSDVKQTIKSNSVTAIMAYEVEEGSWTKRTDEANSIERKQGDIVIEDYEE